MIDINKEYPPCPYTFEEIRDGYTPSFVVILKREKKEKEEKK
jgi:hypothetical protein